MLASRFHQMFPVLSGTEIDHVRRFGEVRRFAAGDFLFHAGEAVPGMYVILSGRIAIVPRDGLGQTVPVAAFAELIGAPLEEMTEALARGWEGRDSRSSMILQQERAGLDIKVDPADIAALLRESSNA